MPLLRAVSIARPGRLCRGQGFSAKDELSLQDVGVCAEGRVSLSDIFHFGVHFSVLGCFSEIWGFEFPHWRDCDSEMLKCSSKVTQKPCRPSRI